MNSQLVRRLFCVLSSLFAVVTSKHSSERERRENVPDINPEKICEFTPLDRFIAYKYLERANKNESIRFQRGHSCCKREGQEWFFNDVKASYGGQWTRCISWCEKPNEGESRKACWEDCCAPEMTKPFERDDDVKPKDAHEAGMVPRDREVAAWCIATIAVVAIAVLLCSLRSPVAQAYILSLVFTFTKRGGINEPAPHEPEPAEDQIPILPPTNNDDNDTPAANLKTQESQIEISHNKPHGHMDLPPSKKFETPDRLRNIDIQHLCCANGATCVTCTPYSSTEYMARYNHLEPDSRSHPNIQPDSHVTLDKSDNQN